MKENNKYTYVAVIDKNRKVLLFTKERTKK